MWEDLTNADAGCIIIRKEKGRLSMYVSVDFEQPLYALGLKNAACAVKAAGFDAVDFSFKTKTGLAMLTCDLWQENAKRTRQVLDEQGLVCNQAHAPMGFSAKNKMRENDLQFALLLRCFDFAKTLGAKIVVVHAVTDVSPVDFIPYNLRFYKSLEKYARIAGVKIGVENLFTYDERYHRFDGVFERSEKLTSFIQKLRSDVFVACVDTGHAALTGTPPEKYIAGMNASVLGALHLHDNDGKDDLHLLPTRGTLDWESILSALKKLGYRGDITFEIMFYLEKFKAEELPLALRQAGALGKRFKEYLTE